MKFRNRWFGLTCLTAALMAVLVACPAGSITPPNTGTLQVNVTGLPAGASANVSVTGPGGFGQAIVASKTLSGLVPGAYSVTASNVLTANFTFSGTVTGDSIVVANATATATVNYAAVTGSLSFEVTGLPAGAIPTFTLTDISGPNIGQKRTLTGTATVANLPPVDYNLIANPVRVGGAVVDTVFIRPGDDEFSISVGQQVTLNPLAYQQKRHSGALWVPNNDGAVLGLSTAQLGGAGGAITPAGSITQAGSNQAVAFDPNGNMYVSNSTANVIQIFPVQRVDSPAPTPVTISGANTGLTFPTGMAFDGAGQLWVANVATPKTPTGDSIVAFRPDQLAAGGNQKPAITITSSSFNDPVGLAFSFNGELWVSNVEGNSVLRFSLGTSPDSGPKTPFGTLKLPDGTAPNGLAFDKTENLWVAAFSGNNLLKFADTQLVEGVTAPTPNVTIGGFSEPRGLAFDNSGNLWVARSVGTLNQIAAANLSTSGSPAAAQTITGLGVLRTAGLAFSPVPPNLPLAQSK